jgi:sporulation protein YlmC with PRC-barrel domain
MRFSEAKNRKVISTTGATTVGKLQSFVVDPRGAHVVALTLKKTEGDGDTLVWSSITSFGRDAVTVESADLITQAEGDLIVLSDKQHRVLGKRVLSERGDELGKVKDVEFDPDNGAVRSLITDTEEIAGARMVGLGTYALVVRL